MPDPVLVERDFIIIEDPVYNIIEVTDSPPGVKGDKGDKGDTGDPGPGFPITLFRRGQIAPATGRMKYRFPMNATLIGISAAMGEGTPPVGSDLTMDINVNGSVVYTLTVPDGVEDVSEIPLNIPVVMGDYITADITAVGATSPGEDLSVFIRYDV